MYLNNIRDHEQNRMKNWKLKIKELPGGFLLIDKPSGPSSYDIIREIKKHYPKGTKIGHGGTLDPLASGLLVIGIGRDATKKLGDILKGDKTYEVTAVLGKTYDTYDITGKLIEEKSTESVTLKQIKKVLKSFEGDSSQIPPMFSALKHKGEPLYKFARQGIEIERKPRKIIIKEIKITSWENPYIKFTVTCGSGTYIRSLVDDIVKELGCGGAVFLLRKTQIRRLNIDIA